MTTDKMNRINELARKSKITELTAEEKAEQKTLRDEYIAKFRESFRAQLERIKFVDEPDAPKERGSMDN
ncbi:MAG: DUF896 domain-containing protein [Clostridiales bacterium]|nr:DUF896 domain-containing protein [Clostridiales bacterium]